jgi:hypothetical protein
MAPTNNKIVYQLVPSQLLVWILASCGNAVEKQRQNHREYTKTKRIKI